MLGINYPAFHTHISSADFFSLSSASTLSLRSLTIRSLGEQVPLDLRIFPNLDRLERIHNQGVRDLHPERTHPWIRATLSSLSVRHLALDFECHALGLLAHLDSLPRTLETLRIPPLAPSTLADFLDPAHAGVFA